MCFKNALLCSAILLGSQFSSTAQTFVPPNIDFESGLTPNWTYYKGTIAAGPVFSLTPTPAVPTLHTLTSLPGTDMYGGFSIVGLGIHSLKLAHDTIDNNADGASYNINVPVGGSYSVIYHYAAVLQDGLHAPSQQATFDVSAIDSATGTALPGVGMTLNPTSPGFVLSGVGSSVKYKSWNSGSLSLAGYGGHTVTIRFRVGSCATGAHFGYGYIDINSVHARMYTPPCSATTASITAPAGYSAYAWKDSTTFGTIVGTTATVSVPMPTSPTTYAVICTPYAGYGGVDTLYTTVVPPAPAPIAGASSVIATHSTTLTDATPGGTWSSSNTAIATVGAATGIVTGVAAGTATISYMVGTSCEAHTSITVSSSLGTPGLSGTAQSNINLYPNPTSGNLKIEWINQMVGTADVTVTDVVGRVVNTSTINMKAANGDAQINLSALNNGVYVVNIKAAHLNYSGKVVVQK